MTEQTELRKLLVLRGPSLEAGGIVDFLREHFDVQFAEDLEGALAAMRDRRFVAVLAETADFLPLERGIVSQQASVVLDTIGDGVCIVGEGGDLVWANRRVREFPTDLLNNLRKLCVEAFEQFAAKSASSSTRGKRFSMMREDGMYLEVICSPVRDRQGILRQVAAVVVDSTTQRRQQMKLNAIDRAGRELVRLEYDLLKRCDAAERLQALEERIIRCSRDVLDYQHFALLMLDEKTNRLETLTAVGLTADAQKYELFASTDDNGICGYVAATGRSYICSDVRKDPRYLPALEGARSSLTVPIRLQDKVIGVLNAESRMPNAFGEEDRQFAEIFANYVAMALHILNLLIFERTTTHTEISGSICAEATGPLNDIVSEVTELVEDYIGHDDLRKRLNGIIDLAARARHTIQQYADAPKTGVLDASSQAVQQDPILTGKRILVADDEELIRQTVSDVLRPYGCAVDVAANGTEAIKLLEGNRYDLVISDIKMPGATGYDVFQSAKNHHPETEVILITGFGYDPHHSIVKANREGLSAVLMKPFKVRQLLDECRTALGGEQDQ